MLVASIVSALPGAVLAPLDRRGHAIDLRPIAPILALVVQRWSPLQIWLFGSRARASDFEADRPVPNALAYAYATWLDGVLVHEGRYEMPREG